MFVNNRLAIPRPADIVPSPWLAASICRRVVSSYTGNLIRVRRDSDNAESDIGQTAQGVLDKAALDAFVGGADGWLVNVYDQSGNGRHLEESSASNQGQIVDGVTEIIRGFPITHFDGTSHRIWYDTGGTKHQPATVVIAFYPVTHVQSDVVFDGAGSGADWSMAFYQVTAGTTYGLWSGAGGEPYERSPVPIQNVHVATVLVNGAGGSRMQIDDLAEDTQVVIGNAQFDGLTIATSGNRIGTDYCQMAFHEVLLYDQNMSQANRQALHRNVNGYYRIYS
jgi:hypothetical protein